MQRDILYWYNIVVLLVSKYIIAAFSHARRCYQYFFIRLILALCFIYLVYILICKCDGI